MSLSNDPISPTDKNQESRQTTQDPFLTIKETEESSFLSQRMSQEQTFLSMNKNEEEKALNPNDFTATNTGNLQTLPGGILGGNFGFGSCESMTSWSSRRDIGDISMIPTPGYVNNGQSSQLHDHSTMQGNLYDANNYDTMNQSGNFLGGSEEDTANMSSLMLPNPITAFVNTSTTNNTNNGQSYMSTEKLLEEPMTRDTQNINAAPSSPPHQPQQPQSPITKELTERDVRSSIGYIVLKTKDVEKHIPEAKGSSGVTINVYDQDMKSMHTLHLEGAGRFSRYVRLSGNWTEHFVERRNLREQETVRFFWDSSTSMLQFSVISRKPEKLPSKLYMWRSHVT